MCHLVFGVSSFCTEPMKMTSLGRMDHGVAFQHWTDLHKPGDASSVRCNGGLVVCSLRPPSSIYSCRGGCFGSRVWSDNEGKTFHLRSCPTDLRWAIDPQSGESVVITAAGPLAGINRLMQALEEMTGRSALDKRGELRGQF